MSGDASDPRADALRRIDVVERELVALAEQAARLRGAVSELRASVAAIERGEGVTEQDGAAVEQDEAADDELAGARLVALDLVLAGAERDEAVLQMAADYPGVDVAALVDEALAAQG